MCFTQEFSFFNFSLLFGYGAYLGVYSSEAYIWRLYIPLIYLSLKDFIQTFLYMFDDNEKYKYVLSVISYFHICFQPLVTNILFSYFSRTASFFNIDYWNIIFVITFIFGLLKLTNLDFFDILKDAPYCKDKSSDFCSDKNGAYIGKYHVGYKFRTKYKYGLSFNLLMVIPALLTNSYILAIIFAFFTILLRVIFIDVRDGEIGAIWCLLALIPTIPYVYYRKQFLSLIEKIKIY
uniref:Uncharacterized protein n=1 Tax=viral metagenome TaxID=1070528 RepID=A0A6C0JKF5_9ZZZZ